MALIFEPTFTFDIWQWSSAVKDKVAMNHLDYPGAVANPKADAVPQWEAAGWKVIPNAPAKPAKMKGQSDD